MSAMDLFLSKGMDYELTHQLIISILLRDGNFARRLFGEGRYGEVEREPQGGLFDLRVEKDDHSLFIEMKMWSSLSDEQIEWQAKFIDHTPYAECCYLLLGSAWFERDRASLERVAKKPVMRIGYEELMDAIHNYLNSEELSGELLDLASAYLQGLQHQFEKLNSAMQGDSDGKYYHYGIYKTIKLMLPSMSSEIYSVNNRGGEVYILNFIDLWKNFKYKEHTGELYYEIVNGKLCIKLNCSTNDVGDKRAIRQAVRAAIKEVLAQEIELQNSGRLGNAMTACQIVHDFRDLNSLNKSLDIIRILESRHSDILHHLSLCSC